MRTVAIFVDAENMANWIDGDGGKAMLKAMREHNVLSAYAYGDFDDRYKPFKSELKNKGYRPINTGKSFLKNTADIKMGVDIVRLAITRPDVTDFVIVTKDRDFLPIFKKLRGMGKNVTVPVHAFNDISDVIDYDNQLFDFDIKDDFARVSLTVKEAACVVLDILAQEGNPMTLGEIQRKLRKKACFYCLMHGYRHFREFLKSIKGINVISDECIEIEREYSESLLMKQVA